MHCAQKLIWGAPGSLQRLTRAAILAKRFMLPAFDEGGNLPPGLHRAGWTEFVQRLGCAEHRLALIAGMAGALASLGRAGCPAVYIDGIFVAARRRPADYDGCWDDTGVNTGLLDPVLLNLRSQRRAQKAKYRGELFPASLPARPDGPPYKEFFQLDRDGEYKGIVEIDPGDLNDQE